MAAHGKHASDRLLDGCVAALTWWTLCCNATVLTGGTGWQLLITAAVTGTLALAGLAFAFKRRARTTTASHASQTSRVTITAAGVPAEASAPLVHARASWRELRWWALVVVASVIAWWPKPIDNWALWSIPAGLVAVFAVSSAREPWRRAEAATEAPAWHRRALWTLAFAGALLTACLHLPNTDDVLYVNIAVALADEPARVLFSADTLHGANVIPHVAYHLHSFELLAGALSAVTGIPPLEVLHLGLAVLAGLLVPLAWARLFRLLDSRRALWMVAVVMLWYVLDGTTPFSVSMHAFARLFQGKAVLATAGVAAIAAYGLEFALRPSTTRLLWLAAAQVAGLGLSSTGIWLCPLVAATSVAAAQPPRLRALRPMALAVASSSYVLAMGIWVLLQLKYGSGGGIDSADRIEATHAAANEAATQLVAASPSTLFDVSRGFERIRKAFTLTFFTFDRGMAYGAFLLLAWPLARTALARRYIAAFMVVGLFFLCSPWLAALIAERVTGYSTYPRVTWFFPFGAALALCFVAPITIEAGRARYLGSLALSAALAGAFFAHAPKATVLAAAHFAWPPRVKVERPAYEVALWLRARMPAGSVVIAPRAVTLHLPLLQGAPHPIMTKERYFVDVADRKRRMALRRRTEHEGSAMSKTDQRRFVEQLDAYAVRAMVLTPRAARTKGLHKALTSAGFHMEGPLEGHEMWIREDFDSP